MLSCECNLVLAFTPQAQAQGAWQDEFTPHARRVLQPQVLWMPTRPVEDKPLPEGTRKALLGSVRHSIKAIELEHRVYEQRALGAQKQLQHGADILSIALDDPNFNEFVEGNTTDVGKG